MALQQLLMTYLLPQSFIQALLAVAVILVIYIFHRVCLAPRLKLRQLGVSYPTPKPFVGNLFDYGADNQHICQIEWHKKYGHVYASQFFHVPVIWISNLDTVKKILAQEFGTFANRYRFNKEIPPLDKTLVELCDHEWKRVRNVLIPTFAASKLRVVVPIAKRASQDFIDEIIKADRNDQKFDVWNACGYLSIKVILGTAFGVAIDNILQGFGKFTA